MQAWYKLEENRLAYGLWDDVQTTVRASLFAHMLDIAKVRVKHYQSDLYHDALWVNENIKGPMQFDWIARESGTFIGESAMYHKAEDWSGAVKYRFELINDDGTWRLITWEGNEVTDPDVVAHELVERFVPKHEDLPVTECEQATTVQGCIYHPAPYLANCTGHIVGAIVHHDGDTCPQHENDGSYGEAVKFPTLGNTTIKKGITMDRLIEALESKKANAEEALDELRNGLSEIEDEISNGEDYIDQLDTLLSTLNDLPYWEISVNVDVSFDSND